MSGSSWWRSPSAADQFAGHDYADFAQEFLRRNADYRSDLADTQMANAADPSHAVVREAGLAARWGLCLPCAIDASPIDQPVQWAPEVLATVILQEGDTLEPELPPRSTIRAYHDLPDGRHLVVDVAKTRYRLCLHCSGGSRGRHFLIPVGLEQVLRAETTTRFLRLLDGRLDRNKGAFVPTLYARRRLILQLALVDAKSEGATAQDIARLLVFPRSTLPTGTAWKGAGERRHTLRLLAQSQQMLRAGFRRLPGFAPMPAVGVTGKDPA